MNKQSHQFTWRMRIWFVYFSWWVWSRMWERNRICRLLRRFRSIWELLIYFLTHSLTLYYRWKMKKQRLRNMNVCNDCKEIENENNGFFWRKSKFFELVGTPQICINLPSPVYMKWEYGQRYHISNKLIHLCSGYYVHSTQNWHQQQHNTL